MSTLSFLSNFVQSLNRHQVKALAFIIDALLSRPSSTLAEIARTAAIPQNIALNHCLKRVQRFLSNPRICNQDVYRDLIKFLWPSLSSWQRIPICIDWTFNEKKHPWWVLRACVVLKGRGLPILSWSFRKADFEDFDSQNQAEEAFVKELLAMLPSCDRVIILADRGFARSDFLAFLDELGLKYVIRVSSQSYLECKKYQGLLADLPVHRGVVVSYKNAIYTKRRPIPINQLVVTCSTKPDQHDPWFLATNLRYSKTTIVRLYERRMTIEEDFREAKARLDWKNCRIKKLFHYRRFVLILEIALMISVLVGTVAHRRSSLASLVSRRRKGQWDLGYTMMGLRLLENSLDYLKLFLWAKFIYPL